MQPSSGIVPCAIGSMLPTGNVTSTGSSLPVLTGVFSRYAIPATASGGAVSLVARGGDGFSGRWRRCAQRAVGDWGARESQQTRRPRRSVPPKAETLGLWMTAFPCVENVAMNVVKSSGSRRCVPPEKKREDPFCRRHSVIQKYRFNQKS